MPNESFVLLALTLATKQISELLVDFPMSRMPKLKLLVWRQPQRCHPSFPKHRASNHPSLRLQAWRWSDQACHQYQSMSSITTNQAPYMLQQSCASLVLACQFGIGIVHSSQNIDRRIWPVRMRWTPPAQSRSLSSHLIPYSFPYISCLGCQQRMSWPHAAQATMQGWPPLNILSPPCMVTKPWVVVLGFGSILHLNYHGQHLHSLS